MKIILLILSLIFIMHSCSSPKNETSTTSMSSEENSAFQDLRVVRVMPQIISKKIDQTRIKKDFVQELEKIGTIHTPSDTSIEKLLKAQSSPFGLLIFSVNEIDTENDEQILHISCKLYEETELMINKKRRMSNVWEAEKYVSILQDQDATTEKVIQKINELISEFTKNYSSVNPSSTKINFYINPN